MGQRLSEPYAGAQALFLDMIRSRLPPHEFEHVVKDSGNLFQWLEAHGILPDDLTDEAIAEYQNDASGCTAREDA